jgi:hypothetical protein
MLFYPAMCIARVKADQMTATPARLTFFVALSTAASITPSTLPRSRGTGGRTTFQNPRRTLIDLGLEYLPVDPRKRPRYLRTPRFHHRSQTLRRCQKPIYRRSNPSDTSHPLLRRCASLPQATLRPTSSRIHILRMQAVSSATPPRHQ